jgi:predicted deacylase
MSTHTSHLRLQTFDATDPGPTVTILGGVHGDEEAGVLAVQIIRERIRRGALALARGALRTVDVANEPAYAASSRFNPLDQANLARLFPGVADGSSTEQIAHRLSEDVIRGSDLLVDLHSAGQHYSMPRFVGYVATDDAVGNRSAAAAKAFAAPIIWEHPPPIPPGRSLSAAYAMGIPAIYAEGHGGSELSASELKFYVAGVEGVLEHMGMVLGPAAARPSSRRVIRGSGGNLDEGITSRTAGRFVRSVDAGSDVEAGQLIGEIFDDAGRVVEDVRVPRDSLVMFLRRTARVQPGDVICSLAPRTEG